MSNCVRILSISDDDGLRYSRELVLTKEGYDTQSVTSNDALSFFEVRSFDIALICRSVDPERATALCDLLRSDNPEIQIICVAPIEDDAESSEANLEVSSGPQPLLEAIRTLCDQRAAARKELLEVSHLG